MILNNYLNHVCYKMFISSETKTNNCTALNVPNNDYRHLPLLSQLKI